MSQNQSGAASNGADQDCILDVRSLFVRHGARTALEDVTFSLSCGESVAVVGPNGAGKTTLFKAIAGLAPSADGTIVVHGHEPGVGLCVAYVQQRRDVDWAFPLSVGDVVMMGRAGRIGPFRRPSTRDRRQVATALSMVGLADLADRQIGELSGGQQQRMFIARALAQEAELILMDEPFTGLDATSGERILEILASLKDNGVGVMVATHDLSLAAQDFDRVMLLNRRLIGYGWSSDVFTEPNLVAAYGGGARLVRTADGLVVSDAGCGEHRHHG
jgi:ABC-type Mn2+/Zn2+ transport system ATPase subunit